MTEYVPLIEKVEIVRAEEGETPRVWYRLVRMWGERGNEPKPGDWVMLVARVNSVRASGGYRTGAAPPGAKEKPPTEESRVENGLEFRLEQKEIYYFPGLEGLRKEKP